MCGAKRCFALMMTVLLLFCGCTSNDPTDRINQKYGEMERFSSDVRYTLDSGDYLTVFEMALDYGPEGCSLTLKSPTELEGLKVTLDADTAEVVYGERVLVLDSLKGLKISPIRILPNILDTLKRGLITSYSSDGMCQYYSELGGVELCYCVWFGDELEPLRAEVSAEGETVATVEFIYGEG
ncbi:MAG: hypothetical protein IKM04_04435 [Clostridia bacterium]|nr:hypothetical protein [Clostridia bacterium]